MFLCMRLQQEIVDTHTARLTAIEAVEELFTTVRNTVSFKAGIVQYLPVPISLLKA